MATEQGASVKRLLFLLDRHQWIALAGIAVCLILVEIIEKL